MKKKYIVITALIFVVSFITSCFIGCGKPDDVVEITVKVPASNTINSIAHPETTKVETLLTMAAEEFAEQYDKYKVKVNVVEIDAGGETKAVYNKFGTSEAADILYDGFFNMSSFIHTGHAVPLDDVLSAEMTEDLNATYLDGGKYGGKLYMMPYLVTQNVMIYDKQMFRDCDLGEYIPDDNEIITNWTNKQWRTILDTLAKRLPDGYVPMMMYCKDNQGDTHLMTYLRAFGGELFDENNRFKLVDNPAVIEAMEWIQYGAANGWFLPYPQNKVIMDNNSKFIKGEMAIYHFNLGSPVYETVKQKNGLDKYGFVNYPGNYCTIFSEGFEVYDNGDPDKVTVAKDFLRYFYSTDKWMEYSAGGIPASKKVMDKYQDRILLLNAFFNNSVNAVDYTRNVPNWQGTPTSVRSVFYKEFSKLFVKGAGKPFAYTPEDVALKLQTALNNAIDGASSNPHR